MINYLEELKQNYGEDVPILLSEIAPEKDENIRIRQYLNRKCKEGKIRKFDRGVYFFPSYGQLFGERRLPPYKVIERKYITDNKEIYGVYSGIKILNMYGFTTQVPGTDQIVSNNVSRKRALTIGGMPVVVKPAPVTITKENRRAVEIAEVLSELAPYEIEKYKKELKKLVPSLVSKSILREVISMYPAEVSKKAIQGGIL